MRGPRRSTPEGEHRPVLLKEILHLFNLQPGQTVVDATVGWGGHAAEFLKAIGPDGTLVGLDLDSENLVKAQLRLDAVGGVYSLHHANFAGVAQEMAGPRLPLRRAAAGVAPRRGPAASVTQADALLADLGFSSMQVDDAARGFSYR